MGWGSGSSLFSEIIRAVQPRVADEKLRKEIYKPIIEAFRDDDWDTYDECIGDDPAYDDALRELDLLWDIDGEDEDEDDEAEVG